MKSAGALSVLLVLGLIAFFGYVEFLGKARGGTQGISDPSGWSLRFASGRSQLLGRETLQIIVISKSGPLPSRDDGRTLEIAGRSLGGTARLFLFDEKRTLIETRAPVFSQLWSLRDNFEGRLEAWNAKTTEEKGIRSYLRATLDPASLDPALRDFLAPPGKR